MANPHSQQEPRGLSFRLFRAAASAQVLVALVACASDKKAETASSAQGNAKDVVEPAPRRLDASPARPSSKRCRSSSSPPAPHLREAECDALVFVLETLGGAELMNKGVAPCEWRGVSCSKRDGALHVVELNLHSTNLRVELSGELPARIEELAFLEELMLSGHEVRWPVRGLRLPSLRRLNLAGTGQKAFPAGLAASQLIWLNLATNKIVMVPASVSKLKSLKTLQLSGNPIEALPASMDTMTWLRQLAVGQCRLRALPNLALEGVNADNNLLRTIPPKLISNKLTVLALNYNGDLKFDHRKLAVAKNMTHLSLKGTGLRKLPPEIGQLTKLRDLFLSDNPLTELPPEIGNLVVLSELELKHTKLTSLPPEVGKLEKLRGLYAQGSTLKSLPSELAQLDNLKRVKVCPNPLVVSEGVRAFLTSRAVGDYTDQCAEQSDF